MGHDLAAIGPLKRTLLILRSGRKMRQYARYTKYLDSVHATRTPEADHFAAKNTITGVLR